ncbi:MAG: glycosyltransferase involved in cell wall biosynthesis [Polaribacter sp.]|jgi:glycosyltransferase involved in cell wall biosynthesis
MIKKKLIRITTVPISLEKLLENQLRFMKENYLVTAISADKERLLTFGEEEGVSTFHLELTRKITPIKDVIAVLKLYIYLKKEKPQIVHTHTPKAGMVGMLASYLAKVPNRLHTVAGLPLLESKGFKRKVLNFVEKITYSCATKVYPNSFGLKAIIIEAQFCKVSKLKVLANGSSNGIDTSTFNPENFSKEQNKILRKELALAEEDVVFIFVGRLVGDKGINELVAAFDTLTKRFQNIKLLLVGAFESDLDPLNNQTLKMIDGNSAILSAGFQQDVRPYFAIADALVFPSYREGFPNVVLQAGAMGLPSIVSDINGCNEIIKEEENGLIISVKDSEAIYKAMKRVLEDSVLKNKLQNNARNMITELYEQKVVWNALLKEYKSLEKNV